MIVCIIAIGAVPCYVIFLWHAICISVIWRLCGDLLLWCRHTTFRVRWISPSPRRLVNPSRFRRGTSPVYHETASLSTTESLSQTLADGTQSNNHLEIFKPPPLRLFGTPFLWPFVVVSPLTVFGANSKLSSITLLSGLLNAPLHPAP